MEAVVSAEKLVMEARGRFDTPRNANSHDGIGREGDGPAGSEAATRFY